MNDLPFAAKAPVSISKIGLRARDAEALAAYYRSLLGLRELGRDKAAITLGTAQRPLMEIESDPAAKPDDPRSAGLFHTAFLFPARADLGRWINHAVANDIRIEGATDHLVSEAVYLTDPEGNGIEIYVDRSESEWKWNGSSVEMANRPLDIPSIRAEVPRGDEAWQAAPDSTVIGHVHLRVGDTGKAEIFWHEKLGFDTVARSGGQAVFMSTGGYHHHIAANTWRSAGAGRRDDALSGLSWVELRGTHQTAETVFEDPWGTPIRFVPAKELQTS